MSNKYTLMPRPSNQDSAQEKFRQRQRTQRAIEELQQTPILGGTPGVLLKEETIGTSATTVQHGLNRDFQGWIVTRKRGNATVYEDATQTRRSTEIRLIASSSVEVDIWVF